VKKNNSPPFSAESYEIARDATSPLHKKEGRKEMTKKKEYVA